MNQSQKIAQELMRFASNYPRQINDKYLPIFEALKVLNIPKKHDQAKCLIIGGGTCQDEIKLLQEITVDAEIFALDSVEPTKSPNLNLRWIEGYAPESLAQFKNQFFDVIICLGASNYFTDTQFVIESICKKAKYGSIFIFDIMQIAPIKAEVKKVLRAYLFDSVDLNEAFSKLKQLSEFFCALSKALSSQNTLNDVAVPELGIKSATPFQQVVFDAIIPIYFRENFDIADLEVLTLWHVMSEGALPLDVDITRLLSDCDLNLLSELVLNENRKVLITTRDRSLSRVFGSCVAAITNAK